MRGATTTQCLILVILSLHHVASVHIELSNKLLGNFLQVEHDYLQILIDKEWHTQGQPYRVDIDYHSLQTQNGKDINEIDVIFNGNLIQNEKSPISFKLLFHGKLAVSKPFSTQHTAHEFVEVTDISDINLKSALKTTFSSLGSIFLDQTSKNPENASNFYFRSHYIGLTLAKFSGRAYSNGNSLFLDSSLKDPAMTTSPQDIYDKFQQSSKPRYFGFTLHDKILSDIVNEFCVRIKELNIVELMSLFPGFDAIVAYMKLGKLNLLFPDFVSEYGEDKGINILLNPNSADEQMKQEVVKLNKVTFKKDQAEVLVAWTLELLAENTESNWVTIRTGMLGLKATLALKQNQTHLTQILLKPDGGIKKIKLVDPKEGEEMKHESDSIFGFVNILLRKNRKSQKIDISNFQKYLLYGGFAEKINIQIIPGFFDLTLHQDKYQSIFQEKKKLIDVKRFLKLISEGFLKIEDKKRVLFEKKLKRLQQQISQPKDGAKKEDL